MRGMFLSSLVVFGFRHALLSGTIFIIPPVHPRKQPIMRTFLLPVQRQPMQFFRHTKKPEHGSGLRSYPFSNILYIIRPRKNPAFLVTYGFFSNALFSPQNDKAPGAFAPGVNCICPRRLRRSSVTEYQCSGFLPLSAVRPSWARSASARRPHRQRPHLLSSHGRPHRRCADRCP